MVLVEQGLNDSFNVISKEWEVETLEVIKYRSGS